MINVIKLTALRTSTNLTHFGTLSLPADFAVLGNLYAAQVSSVLAVSWCYINNSIIINTIINIFNIF